MLLLAWYLSVLDRLVATILRLAIVIEHHATAVRGALPRLRGSLRRLLRRGTQPPVRRSKRAVAWNRTPPAIDARVLKLKAVHPQLGAGSLARLVERLSGTRLERETVRRILLREPAPAKPRKLARRIDVSGPHQLWGIDLTLVWLFGLFPVWLLGVVDYYGSRVVCLERLRAPATAEVQRVLARVFTEVGARVRFITDNGMVFRAFSFELMLSKRDVEHVFTRPRRPQTNGRIERLFRTFKETVFTWIWLFSSLDQIDRFCVDFTNFYNRDRPHSRFEGKTPDEVFFNCPRQLYSRGPVQYFDGLFLWHRFG